MTNGAIPEVQLAITVLKATFTARPADFVGLGAVFYRPPLHIPSVPLGGWSSKTPSLPVVGETEIARALGMLSSRGSAWHDGFHFIDVSKPALTHVSQYLSPDVSQTRHSMPAELPSGARQLTAMLISADRCVACVALLTTDDQVTIFREGRLHLRTPASNA